MKDESRLLAIVTLLLGSAQVVKLAVGLLRGKLLAILFGPSAIALWGLYQSFMDIFQSVSLLGIEKGALQDLSKSSDIKVVSNKALILYALVLFIVVILLFIINILNLLIPVGYQFITSWAFEISIIFATLNITSMVILNSLQKFKILALTQVTGVIIGNCIAIILLYNYGMGSIGLAFLGLNFSLFLFTFYNVFSLLEKSSFNTRGPIKIVNKFISLGLPFWFPQVLTTGGLLWINIIIEHYSGLDLLGNYIAAWSIAGMFSNILFSSFAGGYFPILCKKIAAKESVDDLVNWQIQFGLLLYSIGAIFLFLFPMQIITLLYSNEFLEAADIIRWFILGSTLRMIGFPLGYAMMAFEKGRLYIMTQVIFNIINIVGVYYIFNIGIVNMLGSNYLVAYFVYVILLWYCTSRILNLKLSLFSFIYLIILLSTMYLCIYINSLILSVIISILLVLCILFFMQIKLDIKITNFILKKVLK